MKSVEDLDVFKLSHQLALEIQEITKRSSQHEKFGIISQMRRSAYSIPLNLLEGSHRLSTKKYRQFVGIAKGSTGEMKYQLLLARDLKYMSDEQYLDFIGKYERVSQMLTRLAQSLKGLKCP